MTFRLRSFVGRNSRESIAQARARTSLWDSFGVEFSSGLVELEVLFGRHAPCYLEIGFGMGQSLLALAKAHPEFNFLGIETHKPGIGALMLGIERTGLTNLRIYNHDAVEVLESCIADEVFAGAQIFFPDPWPKRRHHPRRLIQSSFIKLLITKLKPQGSLHLSTDWEDYAIQMLRVLREEKNLYNIFADFSPRSPYRPIKTKFERRAERENRSIWDLQFAKASKSA